jgi:signal transduction histidine kinase
MKHNITKRLMIYFTTVLILFAVIVGIFFCALISHQTTEIYRNDLEKRAVKIADTLTVYAQGDAINMAGKGSGGGYGAYLQMIDDIAMSDVWIVDQNAQNVSVGNGKMQITYTELPEETKNLVKQVFNGEVAYSESLSTLLGSPSVSVGAPIYGEDGTVKAAVLLHTHLSDLDSTIYTGIRILLISLLIALPLGLAVAIFLSRKFTDPLKKMEQSTQRLIQGDYETQTKVSQNDEIGSLAQNIDILAQKLGLAAKESEALEKMRKDYISNISHELRTPVTVIRGSLEALCDGVIEGKEKITQYHVEMLKESTHLERMVNDLLELSRLQNPDYSIEKSSINLLDVISDAVRSIRHIAKKKQIEIHYTVNQMQWIMEGDYGRLRQMFITVLDNAVKFSEIGKSIEVQTSIKDDILNIAIIDFGVGISELDLPYIFDRFYKTTEANNTKGTGLGLAIAKEIAQRHNISLSADSIPHKKTVFTFICALKTSE